MRTIEIPAGFVEKPQGIVYCSKNKCFYITDSGKHRICKMDSHGRHFSVLAGGEKGFMDGEGAAARFFFPAGITVDSEGDLYVADRFNHRIRKVTCDGRVTTLAGDGQKGFLDGPRETAQFQNPWGITVNEIGTVYVTDSSNMRIRAILEDKVITFSGNGTQGNRDGSGSTAKHFFPTDVVATNTADMYVLDRQHQSVRRIDKNGKVKTILWNISEEESPFKFNHLSGITIGSDNIVYVASRTNDRIYMIAPNRTVSTLAGTGVRGSRDGDKSEATFDSPLGICICENGYLNVIEPKSGLIRRIGKIFFVFYLFLLQSLTSLSFSPLFGHRVIVIPDGIKV